MFQNCCLPQTYIGIFSGPQISYWSEINISEACVIGLWSIGRLIGVFKNLIKKLKYFRYVS